MGGDKLNSKEQKHDLEEGMFYEQVFGPVEIRIERDEETGQRFMTLIDANGETMTIVGRTLQTKVCYYLRKYTEFKDLHTCKPMLDLKDRKLEKTLQKALGVGIEKERPQEFKFLFTKGGELRAITSSLHRQVPWSDIRGVVENAISTKFGKVETNEFGRARTSYRLPISNDNVSAHVGVDFGNNYGKRGIRIFPRIRTERGFGGQAPCMNWANLWQIPTKMFEVDVERLHGHGEELLIKKIHIKDTGDHFDAVTEEILSGLDKLIVAMEGYLQRVNDSVKLKLTKKEMSAILEAYAKKVGLPKYIQEQIMANVKERTVWGFSNALSYVRTHGNFKESKRTKNLEDRRLVQKLENIAGEVISLTPTIANLKKKVGKITLEVLIPSK